MTAPIPPEPYAQIESQFLQNSDVILSDQARTSLIRLYNETVGWYLRCRSAGASDIWASDPDFRQMVFANVHVFSYLLRNRGMSEPTAEMIQVVGREVVRGARTRYTQGLPPCNGHHFLDCPIRELEETPG